MARNLYNSSKRIIYIAVLEKLIPFLHGSSWQGKIEVKLGTLR